MAESENRFDALIIGAGVCGIYMLYRLKQLGMSVRVLERGGGPGGTWYWNRYPGARFDSESYSYGYSFSEELLQEWDWSEHFAAQPETLRYLNHVVDRFSLRDDMQFDSDVESSVFDEAAREWQVTLASGETFRARFLLTAIGMLSAATPPAIPGVDTFKGQSFHTSYWPQEPVELEGKRVAVIGTGATGVQVIGEIADKVGQLTVFQRRPNWCAPLHNGPISDEEQEKIKASYDEIFARCKETPGAFLHGPDPRNSTEVTAEDRRKLWEEIYAAPGFAVWLANFRDILMDPDANAEYSAFIADKIRERVDDPDIAEKLIPKDHGFGSRRVPQETNYYEAYNRDNVRLVDVNETPIEAITETGIRTSAEDHQFDIIVYATGFDAITGAYDRMHFEGVGGQTLRDKWRDGPQTYLGVQTVGFPNMITLAGPQGASVSTNFPRSIEDMVDWTAELMAFLRDGGYDLLEPDQAAEDAWTAEAAATYEGLMVSTAQSWFTGYNSNVEGHTNKDKIRYIAYFGGAPRYRQRLASVAEAGYEGFNLSRSAE